LEKQIKELKQYFIDVSILVSHQGDLINQIEYNVEKSKRHIDDGNTQLHQAVKKIQCSIF